MGNQSLCCKYKEDDPNHFDPQKGIRPAPQTEEKVNLEEYEKDTEKIVKLQA